MARDDFIIRIGGDTAIGGVISTGENFTTAAARSVDITCVMMDSRPRPLPQFEPEPKQFDLAEYLERFS